MCGNYVQSGNLFIHIQGSPPRVRELLPQGTSLQVKPWITPACAGITSFVSVLIFLFKDHPRVCGNYLPDSEDRAPLPGSPPRVRELPLILRIAKARTRITPACAGITLLQSHYIPPIQDHPRVCGNYYLCGVISVSHLGSPPRVRELLFTPSALRLRMIALT